MQRSAEKPAETPEPSGTTGRQSDPWASLLEARQLEAEVDAHPADPNRDAAGRFAPGNVAALVSGARSLQRQALQAEARHELEDRVLADLGETRGTATAALEAVVESFAEASLLRRSAFERLCDLGGPTTTSNRPRAVYQVWLSAHDRAVKDATTLGLHRRARPTQSLADYLATHYAPSERANAPAEAQAVRLDDRPSGAPPCSVGGHGGDV